MRIRLWHIVLMLAIVASCSSPRRISREDMVSIYHDMFIQDQQVRQDSKARSQADTSLVYEGIFRNYGYSTDDYLYSVSYYIKEPEKLAKIMEQVSEILAKESAQTRKLINFLTWKDKMMAAYYQKPDTLSPQPPCRMVDTLSVRMEDGQMRYYPPVDTSFVPGPVKAEDAI